MDLIVTNFTGSMVYIDVTIVSPIIASPHHLAQAAKKPGYAALRAEFGKRQRYPVDTILPFAMEIGGRAGPSAQKFIKELFKTEGSTRDQNIADVWSTLSSALHTATSRQLNTIIRPVTKPRRQPQQAPPSLPRDAQPPVAVASVSV